jgi:hypothetical protein
VIEIERADDRNRPVDAERDRCADGLARVARSGDLASGDRHAVFAFACFSLRIVWRGARTVATAMGRRTSRAGQGTASNFR